MVDGERFPETRLSAVLAVRTRSPEGRRRALDRLITAYWKPLYKYLRLKWKADHETTADWTQGFFLSALERRIVEAWDPGRGAFRTWLRLTADGYVMNERKAAGRRKRGGDAPHLPLDFEGADRELAEALASGGAAGHDPERAYEQEWTRHLFERGLAALRERLTTSGRELRWRIFETADLAPADRPSYRQLAEEFSQPETQITNHLAAARRELRQTILLLLREECGSDDEYDAEVRRLFGSRALP